MNQLLHIRESRTVARGGQYHDHHARWFDRIVGIVRGGGWHNIMDDVMEFRSGHKVFVIEIFVANAMVTTATRPGLPYSGCQSQQRPKLVRRAFLLRVVDIRVWIRGPFPIVDQLVVQYRDNFQWHIDHAAV